MLLYLSHPRLTALILAILVSLVPGPPKLHAQTVAAPLKGALDSKGFPQKTAWASAQPVIFFWDWQGKNADPQRQTEVRALWSTHTLFFSFHATHRGLYTFPGKNTRRDRLWTRDVVEIFIQPPTESGHSYKEIEVSPNGDWLDLALADGQSSPLNCDMKTRVVIDSKKKVWTAELAIPLRCLVENFDPKSNWRVNFFRIEAPEPNRFYSAWQPTKTPYPNFHVPEAFGTLQFSPE
jgi:alpha-galactosidase